MERGTSAPITVNRVRSQPWVQFSKDYVRCFCNLPQCISTGYMCKSSQGGCFSHFLDHQTESRDYRGRHGCLELINNEHECENDTNSIQSKKSAVSCCYQDMCNHIDSPHNKAAKPAPNDAAFLEHPGHFRRITPAEPMDYSSWQVWFRAATIAVPVCGAVILFVLIALAVKILRNENRNGGASRKLGNKTDFEPKHHECNEKIQIPLLIQNELTSQFCRNNSKNATNAKFCSIKNNADFCVNNAIVLEIEKEHAKCADANLMEVGRRDENNCAS